jgi:hypothetical protein
VLDNDLVRGDRLTEDRLRAERRQEEEVERRNYDVPRSVTTRFLGACPNQHVGRHQGALQGPYLGRQPIYETAAKPSKISISRSRTGVPGTGRRTSQAACPKARATAAPPTQSGGRPEKRSTNTGGFQMTFAHDPWTYPESRYYYGWEEGRLPVEPTDGDIKARIVDRLHHNPHTKDCHIKVDVKQRVVILGGEVPSWVAKRSAGDDAWDTPGVVDVSNQLVPLGSTT